jgi:hypothetical protein
MRSSCKMELPFLRAMCGSRTGGWPLSGVMSDWQHGVDWFLAKYCRCRLWLDWCWCRWRTSMKGHCRWGLQVWRTQVGLVRGTRWPAGSSAGRMVARTTRWSWSMVSWLSIKTKVESGLRGSRVMSGDWRSLHPVRGVWFTRKPLGYSAGPQRWGWEPGGC